MTATLVSPKLPADPPPRVPICRSATDPTQPCRFATTCHESRQRIQHYEGLRGEQCWMYQQALDRQSGEVRQHSGTIICHHCGSDFTRSYWFEAETAIWQKAGRDLPDPMVCRPCWRPLSERRS